MPPVHYHLGKFPPQHIKWDKLINYIEQASAAIAKYEGIMKNIPNPDILLSPLTTQEAVLSTRIEGTQATLGDVLEYEAEQERTPLEADIREVLNYRAAIHEGKHLLKKLPLSLRVVKKIHEILMQGVRGRTKAPGEFRKIQNWIGPSGSPLEKARYIPCPVEHLHQALYEWEQFLHSGFPAKLVQLAIIHAEFEAIHPFLDGNGRIGRLLIPLFLYEQNILESPNFYISEYFESNRDQYYDELLQISKSGDWTNWIIFFLKAIIEQAHKNQQKAISILQLYSEKKDWIIDQTHSQYAIRALDWIFSKPIFKSSDFINKSGIPEPTAKRILRMLKKSLLKEIRPASGRKAALFRFEELLTITEKP